MFSEILHFLKSLPRRVWPGKSPQDGEPEFSLFFAYGANMHPRKLETFCPNAIDVEAAELSDYRPIANVCMDDGLGRLNLAPQAGSMVHGYLFRIPADELDQLAKAHPDHQFQRFRVRRQSGESCEALSLLAANPNHAELEMPSWYARVVIEAANYRCLPEDYIVRLRSLPTYRDAEGVSLQARIPGGLE